MSLINDKSLNFEPIGIFLKQNKFTASQWITKKNLIYFYSNFDSLWCFMTTMMKSRRALRGMGIVEAKDFNHSLDAVRRIEPQQQQQQTASIFISNIKICYSIK
jgi:hypothetical protein